LKDELSKELATKADIAELRGKIDALEFKFQGEIQVLREEMKTMNQKINFLIALMIIALTAMNPVVTELLKRWLKL
jgi:hypothetical protein